MDSGYLSSDTAQAIHRVKGMKQPGTRTGNWLTKQQAEALIQAPDTKTLKGKRDRAILGFLIGTRLRRSEVSALTFDHIQQREGRWAIVDIKGKGNRIRTVPIPSWTKALIDVWTAAAGLSTGHVFRPLNNRHEITSDRLLEQNIMEMVTRYAKQIGVPKLACHDLRRTFAKLAHTGHWRGGTGRPLAAGDHDRERPSAQKFTVLIGAVESPRLRAKLLPRLS